MVNEGFCLWYESTKAIFGILGWNQLVRRPRFSALENKMLHNLGPRMMEWRAKLREHLNEIKLLQTSRDQHKQTGDSNG